MQSAFGHFLGIAPPRREQPRKRTLSREEILMSQIVKCEICGRLDNQRYLQSHMRRSHGQRRDGASPVSSESEAIQQILSLAERLSDEGRKRLLERLSAVTEKDS